MKLNLDMEERNATAAWNLADYYKRMVNAAINFLQLNLTEMQNFLEKTNIADELTEETEEQWEQLCASFLLRTLQWQGYLEMLDKARKRILEIDKEGNKNGAASVSAGAGGKDTQ